MQVDDRANLLDEALAAQRAAYEHEEAARSAKAQVSMCAAPDPMCVQQGEPQFVHLIVLLPMEPRQSKSLLNSAQ
jgi:hypothetical protein